MLGVHADGRAPLFAEAIPQHCHKPSDVGGKGADENVGLRHLLQVRHHVHERPIPLAENKRERGSVGGRGEGGSTHSVSCTSPPTIDRASLSRRSAVP